jgi:hypothetical protein
VKLSVGRSAGPPGAGSLSFAYWQHRPNRSSYFSTRDSASRVSMTTPLDLVNLTPLMERMQGKPETTIGLIDGPISTGHPDLAEARIRENPGAIEVLQPPRGLEHPTVRPDDIRTTGDRIYS